MEPLNGLRGIHPAAWEAPAASELRPEQKCQTWCQQDLCGQLSIGRHPNVTSTKPLLSLWGCSSMIFKVPLKRSHSMMLWSGGEQELLAEHPVSQAKPNCLYPSSCLEMKYAPAFRQVKCLNQPHLTRVGIFC